MNRGASPRWNARGYCRAPHVNRVRHAIGRACADVTIGLACEPVRTRAANRPPLNSENRARLSLFAWPVEQIHLAGKFLKVHFGGFEQARDHPPKTNRHDQLDDLARRQVSR